MSQGNLEGEPWRGTQREVFHTYRIHDRVPQPSSPKEANPLAEWAGAKRSDPEESWSAADNNKARPERLGKREPEVGVGKTKAANQA